MRSHVLPSSDFRADLMARDEVVALLVDDHQRAQHAFHQFDRLWAQGDHESCEALVRRTCALLTVHATLEEELFYPAVRQCPEIGAVERRLINEAEIEHLVVRILMSQLRRMSAQDTQFAPLVGVLGRYVSHHATDVEQGILPRLTHASSVDWRKLSSGLRRRRDELDRQWRDELSLESSEYERQQDA